MDINFLTMESLILAQDERWRRASYMQVERAMESLILAQDERWRRASYMQVEREAGFGQWKVADG